MKYEPYDVSVNYITNFTKSKEPWYKPFCMEVEKNILNKKFNELPTDYQGGLSFRVIGQDVYYDTRRSKSEMLTDCFRKLRRLYRTWMRYYYVSYPKYNYTQEQLQGDKHSIWNYNHLRCNIWLDEEDRVKYVDGWY